ncbi:MAG: cell division protein ZapA [Betaproteobacteria bacterium]|nr:cell division protein ZapA [Betaproteobacteria bacterium]
MTNETNYLDIVLLGKEYRIACPLEEQAALRAAVSYLDEKMHEIAERTHSNMADRIAVMAALNVTHEYLTLQKQHGESMDGLDFGAIRRRISSMEEQLEMALANR